MYKSFYDCIHWKIIFVLCSLVICVVSRIVLQTFVLCKTTNMLAMNSIMILGCLIGSWAEKVLLVLRKYPSELHGAADKFLVCCLSTLSHSVFVHKHAFFLVYGILIINFSRKKMFNLRNAVRYMKLCVRCWMGTWIDH